MTSALKLSVHIRTVVWIVMLTLFGVSGLFQPMCDMDISNPGVNDVITLTCRPAVNDSSENITFTWFHDGKNISIDQNSGVVRTKLSAHDYGVTFTCREALSAENQSCSVTPLALAAASTPGLTSSDGPMSTTMSTNSADDPEDRRQGNITILFIAIVVVGGVPILISVVGCIVWISRKTTKKHSSYDLTNKQRPRSDSFDDYDPESVVVDSRPAAPLPGSEMQKMTPGSSVRNGAPSVLKSLVEKESFYSNTPTECPYQNTAMGHSTLPVLSTSKNIYLVPKSSPSGSQEDLIDENAKIYENTGYGNKQHRFETDHTASLPNFRY